MSEEGLVKAKNVHFVRDSHYQLFFINGNSKHGPVSVKRSYPLTDPDHYIVVNDENGKFLAMVDDFTALDSASRQIIDAELDRVYFLPKIQKINAIDDQFSIMVWDVETDRGQRTFEVISRKRDIRWLTDDHIVVEDADGNRYQIEDLSALDENSRDKIELEV